MEDNNVLAKLMETTILSIPGRWLAYPLRKPPKYGKYKVIRRVRSGKYNYDEYLWNGSGWVTHGNSLSSAVEAWYEEEEGNHD